MMMKKGEGLSLTTIIIAAIVLIVLVVLWAIFTGRMGVFSKGLKDTTENQLKCTDDVIGGQVSYDRDDDGNLICPSGKSKVPGTFTDISEGTSICCTQ